MAAIERDNVAEAAKELRPQIVACSAISESYKQYLDALTAETLG